MVFALLFYLKQDKYISLYYYMSQNTVSELTTKMNLETFLNAHQINKNDTKDKDKSITHTEFGKYSKRSFHISKEDENLFEDLYYKEIIKPRKTHNIIERQRIKDEKTAGPLLIDIDLRFSSENTERIYSFEHHILPFVEEYLAEIHRVFEIEEDTVFPIYIQEKPAPRNVIKGTESVVHDGFHLIIGLAVEQMYHEWFRNHMLTVIPTIWENLPIINTEGWKDVLDNSICSGTNGWLKYFSKKADDISCYRVTHALECSFDFDLQQWNKRNIIVGLPNSQEETEFITNHYRKLSARYNDFPTVFCRQSMLAKIRSPSPEPFGCNNAMIINNQNPMDFHLPISTLRQISTKQELELCIRNFLENLSHSEYELKEAYQFTMILPETYYGEGSYNKWVKVGFALKNISYRLLVVFLVFSAQHPNFNYSTQISEICDKWEKFDMKTNGYGLTKKSIMYWAKNDSFEKYEKVREKTIDYYIDQTIETITIEQINNPRKKNAKGSSDYDIATVLFHLCGDEFVSVSIRSNEWYQFINHRWVKNDCGTSLRNKISMKLRDLYNNKSSELVLRASQKDPESEEFKLIMGRANKVLDIAFTLGSTKDKDNIMKEAKEIFYNSEFLDKLDQNKYLLCFTNGVVDFKNKCFRKGYPEDYISKCTESDYIPLNPSIHQPIMGEIHQYMSQLFPEKELCDYVWTHLASCLIGDTALNQCLHYYTGIGQNGKSMLVKLMQLILGSYAGELDVGFYTQERAKRGQSTPELFAIIGVRFAITSEPSEGDKMNEGPMKQLTSGTDPMSCRAPYGQLMKFIPQANAIIMANHFLEVKSRDHGTWRRIRVVTFKSLFTDNPVTDDPDKPYQFKKIDNLDLKFDEWKFVFMAMLVEKAFMTNGICKVCDIVSASSNQYRQNQDVLAEFIGEKISKDVSCKLKKSTVCYEFTEWYRSTYGGRVNKTKELYAVMDKQFGVCKNNAWNGITIVSAINMNNDNSVSGTDLEEDDDDDSSFVPV